MLKPLLVVFGVLVVLLSCLLVYVAGGRADKSALPSEQKAVDLLLLRAKGRMMGPGEIDKFYEYAKRFVKWRRGKFDGRRMERFLGWEKRQIEARLVVPSDRVRLGEQPRVGVVLRNVSDTPQIVFSFVMYRVADRKAPVKGIRTDVISLREEPLYLLYLWSIPPRDELLMPFDLPAQPAGTYRVDLRVQLAKFSDTGDNIPATSDYIVARQTIQFEIVPAGKEGDVPLGDAK